MCLILYYDINGISRQLSPMATAGNQGNCALPRVAVSYLIHLTRACPTVIEDFICGQAGLYIFKPFRLLWELLEFSLLQDCVSW